MTGTTIYMTCSFEDLKQMMREVFTECTQNQTPSTENRLLTREEVCEILHIGSTTLNKVTRLGIIQGHRMGKRVLYKESEVMDALQEMPNRKKWKKKEMEDDVFEE